MFSAIDCLLYWYCICDLVFSIYIRFTLNCLAWENSHTKQDRIRQGWVETEGKVSIGHWILMMKFVWWWWYSIMNSRKFRSIMMWKKNLFNLLKIDESEKSYKHNYLQSNIEIWQPYTDAVDMRNCTHKHPVKDVIHCGSHMRTATGARRMMEGN